MPVHTLHLRRVQPAGQPPQKGDEVTWTNPNTGERWPGLRVEAVLPGGGAALLKGHFGKFHTDGTDRPETRTGLMADLVVFRRAGESV